MMVAACVLVAMDMCVPLRRAPSQIHGRMHVRLVRNVSHDAPASQRDEEDVQGPRLGFALLVSGPPFCDWRGPNGPFWVSKWASKEVSCPTMVIGRGRNFHNWSDDQGRSPRWVGREWKTLAQLVEVFLTKRLQVQPFTNAPGKYFIDVFGGSGFLFQATNHWGLRGYVLDTKFRPKYDVTQPLFSPEFDKTSPLEIVSQE